MPSGLDRQHIPIDRFAQSKPYRRPDRAIPGRDPVRETARHAETLARDLAAALAQTEGVLAAPGEAFVGEPGRYVEFEGLADQPLPNLNWKSQGILLAAARRLPAGGTAGAIFVPDDAVGFLNAKIAEYRERRGVAGRPSHQDRFAAVETFRAARLESLWIDSRPLPGPGAPTWWECWCWPDRVPHLLAKAEAAGSLVAEERLRFAEREVVFVHADRASIARIVAGTDAVAELRLGRDDAAFFTSGAGRAGQAGWLASAVDRIRHGDRREAVAVCLLDTGINRAHPLLEPVFAEDDLHALNPAWGTDDHHGHGSEMSGLAFYGDLTAVLPSVDALGISYVGESVKLLAPDGFVQTEPRSYGLAMQQALSRPEIAKPRRERVFCMAVTQPGVHGPRATSWSASLDASAFGGRELGERRQRLVCVSAGNLPDGLPHSGLEDWDSYEVEDPAHAWNALTVGGYTQKGPITDAGFTHWECAAELGTLSPYSRVSAAWARAVSPIKPELVLEAGNKGIDSAGLGMVSGIDSLSLLTTSRDPVELPFTLSWATSAATAQLAGMGASLLADDPSLWPETVRALLTQSARWTAPMEAALMGTTQKSERLLMLRRFGYGVPSLERARRSASGALALVSQQKIQPFVRVQGKSPALSSVHFYDLPWPRSALLELGAHQVRLRVTLSYFVEPNPSADAPLSPARYRSAGLRFDLRRRGETQDAFEARVNAFGAEPAAAEPSDADDPSGNAADTARMLGERSVSAGSLHVDEWRCNAADLADRGGIAVFPVGGWWKTTGDRDRNNGSMRYALVVTIDAGDVEQDLWAEVALEAGIEVAVEGEVAVPA